MKIKAIIINNSQIVCKSDKAHAYFNKKFKPSVKQLRKIDEKIVRPAKLGKLLKSEILSKMAEEFNVAEKEMLKEYEIGGKLLETNKKNLKLIDKLKKKYKIILVATSTDLYASLPVEKAIYKKYPVVLTYKAKARIGTRKIKKIVLKKLGVKASETLYVDYNSKNIKVAKKMGMETILYRNTGQLKRELEKKVR